MAEIELQGKRALVTGGGSGIGRAISQAYACAGASVLVADFNEAFGAECVQLIEDAGGTAYFCKVDVSDEAMVKRMVDTAVEKLGGLDIACNSAAVSRGQGPIHQFSKEVFDSTLNMCLTNTWLCMKYEIEHMLENGGGSIVNISSNASLRGQAFNTAYASAKSGVNTLTKSAAAEYADKGIRINAVSPGVIATPGLEAHIKAHPEAGEKLKKAALMQRLGEPSEIADAVVFFSSRQASFITGQLLSVDGGGAIR